jgi:hypothetical protein
MLPIALIEQLLRENAVHSANRVLAASFAAMAHAG